MSILNLFSRSLGLIIGLPLLAASASLWAQQPVFATPKAAVDALIEAAASEEPGALVGVLGPGVEELHSGDPVADAAERRAFAEAAMAKKTIELQGENLAVLNIGPEDWPFPIPLQHDDSGWYFDTEAGTDELLNRRIGRNELHTIAVMRAYVDAQFEYAAEDRNSDGKREYAQRLMSSEGMRDGLYWPTAEGEPDSPIGRLVAAAVTEGYRPGENTEPEPYHGYLYRVLTAQGSNAAGGARDWITDGRLTKGFGLIAYPTQYGNTGIMTFMVNQSGLVMERDLGDDTAGLAPAITVYDPEDHWHVVTD